MEQRTKPSVRAQSQQAADLLCIDETSFIVGEALDEAKNKMAEHERTVLSAEDRIALLAAFDHPAEPTEALRQAMALHKVALVHGG